MIGRRVRSCRWAGPARCSRVTLSCWSAWLVIEVGQIEECYLSRASELLLVPLRTGFVMNTGVLAPVPAGARVNSFWNFSLDVRMLPEAVTVTSRRQLIASRQQRSGRCMKHLDLVLPPVWMHIARSCSVVGKSNDREPRGAVIFPCTVHLQSGIIQR
jgi:hypothetical protein